MFQLSHHIFLKVGQDLSAYVYLFIFLQNYNKFYTHNYIVILAWRNSVIVFFLKSMSKNTVRILEYKEHILLPFGTVLRF